MIRQSSDEPIIKLKQKIGRLQTNPGPWLLDKLVTATSGEKVLKLPLPLQSH
jgi:hypothetical protein